jgi:hypothetical protein
MEYIPKDDEANYKPINVKVIPVPAYGTQKYISTPHYKPISKPLNLGQEQEA